MLARLYRAETRVKKAVAASQSQGQVTNSSTTSTLGAR